MHEIDTFTSSLVFTRHEHCSPNRRRQADDDTNSEVLVLALLFSESSLPSLHTNSIRPDSSKVAVDTNAKVFHVLSLSFKPCLSELTCGTITGTPPIQEATVIRFMSKSLV